MGDKRPTVKPLESYIMRTPHDVEQTYFFFHIDCPLDVVITAIVPSVTRKIYGRDAPLGYRVASNLTRCSLRAFVLT